MYTAALSLLHLSLMPLRTMLTCQQAAVHLSQATTTPLPRPVHLGELFSLLGGLRRKAYRYVA